MRTAILSCVAQGAEPAPIGDGWTEVCGTALERALACARGKYQRALLEGRENLSGSTLRGKARRYAVHYKGSRANLLERVARAGVTVSERRGEHGRRILVLT